MDKYEAVLKKYGFYAQYIYNIDATAYVSPTQNGFSYTTFSKQFVCICSTLVLNDDSLMKW